jgi:hypothetical protein
MICYWISYLSAWLCNCYLAFIWKVIENDEVERIWIEAVAVYCKARFQHLLEGTSKATGNLNS